MFKRKSQAIQYQTHSIVLITNAQAFTSSFMPKAENQTNAITRDDAILRTKTQRQQKVDAAATLKSMGLAPDTYVSPTFPTHTDEGIPLANHNCLVPQGSCIDLKVYFSEYETFHVGDDALLVSSNSYSIYNIIECLS